jgi:hypothetical protein
MQERKWKNSRQSAVEFNRERFEGGEIPYDGDPCEVCLRDRCIEVRYEDHRGKKILYTGMQSDPGHFKLEGREGENGEGKKVGDAFLHMFDGDNVLVGYWKEKSVEGVWYIVLE